MKEGEFKASTEVVDYTTQKKCDVVLAMRRQGMMICGVYLDVCKGAVL